MGVAIHKINKHLLIKFLLLLLGSISALDLYAQTPVRIKQGTLYPLSNAAAVLDSINTVGSVVPGQFIIQFSSLPSEQQKLLLKQNGIVLFDYLPENSFISFVKAPVNIAEVLKTPVSSIVPVLPEYKASNSLWQKAAANGNNKLSLIVSFYAAVEDSAIRAFIKQTGGEITPGYLETLKDYQLVIAASKLQALAAWYGVKYISPLSGDVPLDVGAKAQSKVNLVQAPITLGGFGLLGDSVTVGVGDNVSGIYHIDLRDRIINYNPEAMVHHGVFTNGVVGSAGIMDPLATGVAPHVTLVDLYFDAAWFWTGIMLKDHNMTITNDSYAETEGDCSNEGIYDIYSVALDQVSQQYPTVQHCFAAGNDGHLSCGKYMPGFGTVGAGYQTAKNVIVVTSSDKMFYNAWDASRGPVNDGRLKPEVSADGLDVFSCIGVDTYETSGGTSFASPQVAGTMALLTQRYKQIFGNVNPRGDLLKTLIMNGAVDLGNPGPDYIYGYGTLDAYYSMQMLNNNQYITNSITNGGDQKFTFNVPANMAKLKVMLYWHDTAASPLAAHQLVNDLDLTVQQPSGLVHYPLGLDTIPANILNYATEKPDHINNSEQVTINNPAAGTYNVDVKGYRVTTAKQDYVVAYDFEPKGIRLTYPSVGTVIRANDSFHVYWEASKDTSSFNLAYSFDGGATWNTINNNIQSDLLAWVWHVPDTALSQCRLRLTRGADTSVSAIFTINPQPVVIVDSIQCPGYFNINWNSIVNATAYEVLLKKGFYMQPVDTVTATTYSFSGLSLDSTYYAAIRPIINGTAGYRSLAVKRQPDNGNCAGGFSKGDLMLEAIKAPNSGRMYTSKQLGINENLSLLVRNLYSAACNSYHISYNMNGGGWRSKDFTAPISADTDTLITISGLDLSDTGIYTITAAIENLSLTDPVKQNDTFVKTIVNLSNEPVSLATTFNEGFEGTGVIAITNDTVGLSAHSRWDYTNTSDSGRLRTYINDSIVISGKRSVSLDNNQATVDGVQNYLYGTFNLSGYHVPANEVRMEFDYVLHGKPKFNAGNQVWVRGNDTQPWQYLFQYDTNTIATVNHTGTLSVTDAIKKAGQDFSTSFQVRFGQHDTSLIASKDYGNGVTIDNIKLYTVQNDAGIAAIVNPSLTACGLGASTPLTVQVYNGVGQTLKNILFYYSLDGNAVQKDSLTALPGKDTVLFTFRQRMNLTTYGPHTISVWLAAKGDTYNANDSILNYTFHNEPLVTAYPYLQNFEANDGYWYSDGTNGTWQYGTPASARINKAASGSKAWKTNLTGNYNDNETAYLYSPCFDISTLKQPTLSFSIAIDVENCGQTLCDQAYVEYSYDGVNWQKLGNTGEGYNWYNDTLYNVWSVEGFTRWHVATIPLPSGTQPIHLRFVLKSDPGVTFDGVAVDDIHIYDLAYPIYDAGSISTINQNLHGNQWINYLDNNKLLSQIQPDNQALGNTGFTLYRHNQLANNSNTQYYFPVSFTVKSSQKPADSAGLRFYILDTDVVAIVNDTTCASCSRPADAYSLGITSYEDTLNPEAENGTLADNASGNYVYYPARKIAWVPYDKGYYGEVFVPSFSEFWLNDGGPTGIFPIGISYLTFDAQKVSSSSVLTSWTSLIDTAVNYYQVQRAADTVTFKTIATLPSKKLTTANYAYTDSLFVIQNGAVYYRLKWYMPDGRFYYSPIRKVDWTDADQLLNLYPNPARNGRINIQWTAMTGDKMNIIMTDVSGRLLYTTALTAQYWNNTTALQLPKTASGIYFVKIIIGTNIYVKKIVFY